MSTPETIRIDDVEYIRRESVCSSPISMVRGDRSGVFVGEITSRSEDGKLVKIKNARRIWYWSGAASLSELAQRGTSDPNSCKIPVAVNEITITDAIEVLTVTPLALATINSVPVWSR